jgi:hypothetical protein
MRHHDMRHHELRCSLTLYTNIYMTTWQVQFFTELIAACDRIKVRDVVAPYRDLFRKWLSHFSGSGDSDQDLIDGYRVTYTIGHTMHAVPINVHGHFSSGNLLRAVPSGYELGWVLDDHQEFLEYFELHDGYVSTPTRFSQKYLDELRHGGAHVDVYAVQRDAPIVLRAYHMIWRKFQIDISLVLHELVGAYRGRSVLDCVPMHTTHHVEHDVQHYHRTDSHHAGHHAGHRPGHRPEHRPDSRGTV